MLQRAASVNNHLGEGEAAGKGRGNGVEHVQRALVALEDGLRETIAYFRRIL